MPFRETFDCLWCGARHAVRSPSDLEGWAQLCPTCVGRAGDNEFVRYRVRQALAERGAATRDEVPPAVPAPLPSADHPTLPPTPGPDRFDDWYLRRGASSRGPIRDAAWHAELDAAGLWLDGRPIGGDIVELGAATGWWSPLLASRGTLTLLDADGSVLDRARERLVAHGLRAHLHVRDPLAEPEATVDAVFSGASPRPRDEAGMRRLLDIARRWLRPGGMFVLIEPTAEEGGAFSGEEGLRAALTSGGFEVEDVTTTGHSFLLASARRPA